MVTLELIWTPSHLKILFRALSGVTGDACTA